MMGTIKNVLRRKQSPRHTLMSGIWFIIEQQGLTLPQAMYIFVHINSDIHLVHIPALSLAASFSQHMQANTS